MSAHTIKSVIGRRVWDSRGRPTVEAEVHLQGGVMGRAMAPAGASTGLGEAVDLRDGGAPFGGLNVERALASISGPIAKALGGVDVREQAALDQILLELDGTPNKGNLGGNALIAVSMAALNAASANAGVPLWKYLLGNGEAVLPLPEIQIFGGGAHAGNRVDIQDFLIMVPSAETFAEALNVTAEVYRQAGLLMEGTGRLQGVADEGGWWPAFDDTDQALETLVRAIEKTGYEPGADVVISLDIAASQFWRDGRYRLGLDDTDFDSDGMCELLISWLDRYPIAAIEDPLAEEDHAGMKAFTEAVGSRIQVVGDDYLVTNAGRVRQAAEAGICNCALIKPNQAGTVTETQAALEAAKAAGWQTIVSARSGETEDLTIVHLSVGWTAGQFKVGSITRGERTVKWNEMLRIEEVLESRGRFAGGQPLARTWWGKA